MTRVIKDKQYLEAFVFKLNHDEKIKREEDKKSLDTDVRTGLELSASEIDFTVNGIHFNLIQTLEAIQKGKGSETNLNLKKYIKQIRILKDQLQITFFYKDQSGQKTNPTTPTPHINPSEEARGGGQAKEPNKNTSNISKNTSETAIIDHIHPLATKNDPTQGKADLRSGRGQKKNFAENSKNKNLQKTCADEGGDNYSNLNQFQNSGTNSKKLQPQSSAADGKNETCGARLHYHKKTSEKEVCKADTPVRTRLELSASEIDFTVNGIHFNLIQTLEAIQKGKGSETNLNLKKYIKQIRILKDQLQITFFYKDQSWQKTNPTTPTPHINPSEEARGGGQAKEPNRPTPHINPSEEARGGGQSINTPENNSNTAKTDDTKPLLTKNDLTQGKADLRSGSGQNACTNKGMFVGEQFWR